MSPAFSVSAIPIGAVTMMVVHSCRKLRRDTPQAFRCCSIVGFDVPVWWSMPPTSVSDRSGSADGFVVRERVLVGFRVVRSGGDLGHAALRLLLESLFTSHQCSAPVAQRGVNEDLYRCNWHTKAVMRITTRRDSRPRRSRNLSLGTNFARCCGTTN